MTISCAPIGVMDTFTHAKGNDSSLEYKRSPYLAGQMLKYDFEVISRAGFVSSFILANYSIFLLLVSMAHLQNIFLTFISSKGHMGSPPCDPLLPNSDIIWITLLSLSINDTLL